MDRYIRILKEYGKVYIVLEDGPDYGMLYVKDPPENAVSLNEAFSEGKLSEEEFREVFSISDADIPNGRWKSFSRLFSIVRGLEKDPELLQTIYEEAFRSCCENKVFLLESRVILFGDEEAVAERLRLIRDAYYHVKDEYPDFVVRVIGDSGKNDNFDKEFALGILRIVMHLSSEIRDEYDPAHPKNFIIGMDLVNEEDISKPLREYADFFTSDEVRESGLKLFLHAGESLRYDNEEVIDAYLYGALRIGHGINLFRFPELMAKYREKGIAIETSPISNYRLGYVNDFRLHPAQIYLQYGIPVVICSDDGLFLSREPLTDDFYAVILSWDLGVAEIKNLCRNAIVCAGLPQDETEALLAKWEKDWNDFVMNFQE
jgi:adenosine deaminase-related growth factor